MEFGLLTAHFVALMFLEAFWNKSLIIFIMYFIIKIFGANTYDFSRKLFNIYVKKYQKLTKFLLVCITSSRKIL